MQKNLASITNLNYNLKSGLELFHNASLSVNEGDRIGLVGDNGTGKTTLMKILAGITSLSPEGQKSVNCKQNAIHYVEQASTKVAKEEDNQLIYKYIARHNEQWWDTLTTLRQLFNFEPKPNQNIRTLSGGEFMKLKLAIALDSKSDLVIFDEPTNHIDLITKQALVQQLLTARFAYIVISHDIDFLNKTTNITWEIADKSLNKFDGNYDFYLKEKANIENAQLQKYQAARKELNKAKKSLEKEKQRSAHTTKQRSKEDMPKIMRNYLINSAEKSTGKSRLQQNEKIESLQEKAKTLAPDKNNFINLELKENHKLKNNLILNLEKSDLICQHDNSQKLLRDIELRIYYGDRISIDGANGTGKSSLVKAILNDIDEALEKNDFAFRLTPPTEALLDIRCVYLDQNYSILKPNNDIVESFREFDKFVKYERIRKQLSFFKFKEESSLTKKVSDLSEGEKARLAFAILTCFPLDLIILDEPTNNLDISTKNDILKGLKDYPGSMIVISHDKQFLEELEISERFEIKNNLLLKK